MSVTNPDKVVTKQDLKDFYDEIFPYLGGNLPVMGDIDRSMIFSTTEKVVGCWTNGKPLYMKVLDAMALTNASSNTVKTVSLSSLNIDEIVMFSGYSVSTSYCSVIPFTLGSDYVDYVYNRNGKTFSLNYKGDWSSTNAYPIIYYTKTTDAANSFNYASENDYSTTEKIIGTWINGEKIYQKSFTGNAPTTANTNTNLFTWASANKIRNIFGCIHKDGSNIYAPINYYVDSTANAETFVQNGYVVMRVGSVISSASAQYSITIQYTKTT